MNDAIGYHDNTTYVPNPVSYRFNNGVPNQITLRALPHTVKSHVDHDLGIFAQDKWTIGRLTLSGGIRYDYHANSFPEQTLGPTFATPTRNFVFPEQDNLSYHDITPKSQAVVDLFGNGKTALKVSLNKYLGGLGTNGGENGVSIGPNPINVLNTVVRRSLEGRQQQLRARLQPPELGRAGQPCQRRRLLRRVQRCHLRKGHAQHAGTTRISSPGGGSGSTTGSSRPACSTKSCRASRSMLATSGGGTGTSS